MFHESFREEEVSRMFHDIQGCSLSVSKVFQGCSKGVPRVFQRCFKELSRKLSGCFKKFHVAWHSSQLPEQKEGLLGQNITVFEKMTFRRNMRDLYI